MKHIADKIMYKYIILFSLSLFILIGCDYEWLDREPSEILIDEDIWNDEDRIVSLLANYYDRLPSHVSLTSGWPQFAAYMDAMWSGHTDNDGLNEIVAYDFSRWRLWDYDLIRDLNLTIEKIDELSTDLTEERKIQFNAELRFLRALMYFELVKRMGGVPLVTETMDYDFSRDPTPLQLPRNTEEEVYDFIGSELDAIQDDLGNTNSQTRANKYTALALKSRVMLYAGSLAKYNSQMGNPIETDNGEIGIPFSRADDYYQQSLDAATEVINQGPYTLYQSSSHLGENFYEAISVKQGNNEVILAKDYLRPDKTHLFSYENIARAVREDNLSSSSITPTLNLVESFEYLDGSSGELITRTPDDSDYIYFDNPGDIFENKDARLYGTVIYPGATFRGLDTQIQAGIKLWNSNTQNYDTVESSDIGTTYDDSGVLTGGGGPHRTQQSVSNTGFYLRKFVDQAGGGSTRGEQSATWWVKIRLGEIYLNAAEAAYELGDQGEALNYINALRERAGFGENSLSSLTTDQIRNERRVELAFEDHRVWDLKRWRIAHEVWDGSSGNPEAVAYALYPYRVVRPGHPDHNKYVFDKIVAPRFRAPRFFRMGNYYSSIGQDVLNSNPLIIRNPFH